MSFLEKANHLENNSALLKATEIALLQLSSDLTNEPFDQNNWKKAVNRR